MSSPVRTRVGKKGKGMGKNIAFETSVLNTVDGTTPLWESPMFGRTRKFGFLKDKGKLLEQTVILPGTGFRLTRIVTTGHQLEIEVQGTYALLFPLTGRVAYRANEIEITLNAGVGAFLVRPNVRWSAVDPGSRLTSECLIFQFPESFGGDDESGHIKSILNRFPDIQVLRFSDAVNMRLSRYLRLLARELQPNSPIPITNGYLEGMSVLLDECLRDTIRAADKSLNTNHVDMRDLARVKAAENIIYERFREPLHVSEIAKEVGVGVRSLQLAFKRATNLTPREMITQVRLKHAHANLSQPNAGDQVATIAYANGITHLGRFSRAYQEQFGEKPRETLARGWREI